MTIFEKYYRASNLEFVKDPEEIIYQINSNQITKVSILPKLFPYKLSIWMYIERLYK